MPGSVLRSRPAIWSDGWLRYPAWYGWFDRFARSSDLACYLSVNCELEASVAFTCEIRRAYLPHSDRISRSGVIKSALQPTYQMPQTSTKLANYIRACANRTLPRYVAYRSASPLIPRQIQFLCGAAKPSQHRILLSPIKTPENDRNEKQPKADRRHDQKVHRTDAGRMVVQKGLPRRRPPSPAPRHVFGHRRLRDLDPELQQFTMDAWCAP